MSKTKVMRILGVISIFIGGGLIVVTLQLLLFTLTGISLGIDKMEVIGLLIYFFATWGFIISGIGMIKQKKWGVILFAIGVIFWVACLIFYFVDTISSKKKWEDQEKRFMEERKNQFEWAEKEQKYWQEKWKEKQRLNNTNSSE